MKGIGKKVSEVVKKEEQKFDGELKNIDILIKDIEKLYPLEKPSYTFPLVDTIGKTYYNTLKRSIA
jgi:hypothetical protein